MGRFFVCCETTSSGNGVDTVMFGKFVDGGIETNLFFGFVATEESILTWG